jgi:hypothetical protein
MDFDIRTADGEKLVLGMTVYDGSLDSCPARVVEELRGIHSLGVKLSGKGLGWQVLRAAKVLYVDRKKAASTRIAQRQEELKGLLEKVVKKENSIRALQAIIAREVGDLLPRAPFAPQGGTVIDKIVPLTPAEDPT